MSELLHYEDRGHGPCVVFLHPTPVDHCFWRPAAALLEPEYRVLLPDLPGHGLSLLGDEITSMETMGSAVLRLLDALSIESAIFCGCSIGGYINFEIWRQARDRVRAFAFIDTKAPADNAEVSAGRLRAARDVLERGPEAFIDSMIPKVIGSSTRRNRPDIASAARAMLLESSAAGIAAVQRGMAERPDSTPTLSTINVPALVVFGDEDDVPLAEGEAIRAAILLTALPAGFFGVLFGIRYEIETRGSTLIATSLLSAGTLAAALTLTAGD